MLKASCSGVDADAASSSTVKVAKICVNVLCTPSS